MRRRLPLQCRPTLTGRTCDGGAGVGFPLLAMEGGRTTERRGPVSLSTGAGSGQKGNRMCERHAIM